MVYRGAAPGWHCFGVSTVIFNVDSADWVISVEDHLFPHLSNILDHSVWLLERIPSSMSYVNIALRCMLFTNKGIQGLSNPAPQISYPLVNPLLPFPCSYGLPHTSPSFLHLLFFTFAGA